MDKEKVLKRIMGDFFAEVFRMGQEVGRAVDEKLAKDPATDYLNRRYLAETKRKFGRKLKKAGVLPLD